MTDSCASPCIKVCQLNPAQVCIGCGRSLEEIAQWPGAAAEQQRRILENARQRLDGIRDAAMRDSRS